MELLYTVQVSFREHALVPEPFLIVGLIAATRHILVVTAEFAKLAQEGGTVFLYAMLELGLLTVMVLVFVTALVLLRKLPARVGRPGLKCELRQAVVSVTRRHRYGGARTTPEAGPASRADAARRGPGGADGPPP